MTGQFLFFFFLFENYLKCNIYLFIHLQCSVFIPIILKIRNTYVISLQYNIQVNFRYSIRTFALHSLFHSTQIEYILYLKNFYRLYFRRNILFHFISLRVRISNSFLLLLSIPQFSSKQLRKLTFLSLVHTSYIHIHKHIYIAPRFEF